VLDGAEAEADVEAVGVDVTHEREQVGVDLVAERMVMENIFDRVLLGENVGVKVQDRLAALRVLRVNEMLQDVVGEQLILCVAVAGDKVLVVEQDVLALREGVGPVMVRVNVGKQLKVAECVGSTVGETDRVFVGPVSVGVDCRLRVQVKVMELVEDREALAVVLGLKVVENVSVHEPEAVPLATRLLVGDDADNVPNVREWDRLWVLLLLQVRVGASVWLDVTVPVPVRLGCDRVALGLL